MLLVLRRKQYINNLLYIPAPISFLSSLVVPVFLALRPRNQLHHLGLAAALEAPLCLSTSVPCKLCMAVLPGVAFCPTLLLELLSLSQHSTQFLPFENISNLPGNSSLCLWQLDYTVTTVVTLN